MCFSSIFIVFTVYTRTTMRLIPSGEGRRWFNSSYVIRFYDEYKTQWCSVNIPISLSTLILDYTVRLFYQLHRRWIKCLYIPQLYGSHCSLYVNQRLFLVKFSKNYYMFFFLSKSWLLKLTSCSGLRIVDLKNE